MWTDITDNKAVTEVCSVKNAACELNTTILLSTLQACNLTWAVNVVFSVLERLYCTNLVPLHNFYVTLCVTLLQNVYFQLLNFLICLLL
jgi:hypothetical protein